MGYLCTTLLSSGWLHRYKTFFVTETQLTTQWQEVAKLKTWHAYLDCDRSHSNQEQPATPPTTRLLLGAQSAVMSGGVGQSKDWSGQSLDTSYIRIRPLFSATISCNIWTLHPMIATPTLALTLTGSRSCHLTLIPGEPNLNSDLSWACCKSHSLHTQSSPTLANSVSSLGWVQRSLITLLCPTSVCKVMLNI